jgi:hypothetical protein
MWHPDLMHDCPAHSAQTMGNPVASQRGVVFDRIVPVAGDVASL